MVHFAEINQAPYSMLQYIGRVATLKLVPKSSLRYLQITLIKGEGDWSQNLCKLLWLIKKVLRIDHDIVIFYFYSSKISCAACSNRVIFK